ILVLNATPFQMSMLASADLLPGLMIGLFAGAFVDRFRRRPVLIAADLMRGILLLSIPVAAFLHHLHIVHLFITAFFVGILGFLFDVAYISYLPSIVESDKLIEANSRLSATASVAEVAGFGLGGWLVQLLTAPIAIVIDSISFFISAVFVGTIKRKEDSPSRIDEGVSVVEEN